MVTYGFEYPPAERIRVGYLGCGGHSFRNVLPCFQYAPIELEAVCDLDAERAAAFARQFGARCCFTDYQQMLEQCQLDAVFIVTGYGGNQQVLHASQAITAMRAGCHVWMEKPPANSVAEVEQMQAVERDTGRFIMVGFKKVFFPAVAKAAEIAHSESFGPISSIYCRYPQKLPRDPQQRRDPEQMRSFLDHIVHPASILRLVGGPMRTLYFTLDPAGGSVSIITFDSGAVAALYLPARVATAPLERLEVVGEGTCVVVDNGVRLTWYRRGSRGEGGYGRSANFIGPDEGAPIFWEPEFSLGQLYNKNLFLLGYVQEILYFCQCVATATPPAVCGSQWARELMALYDAYAEPEGRVIELG